MCDEHKPLCNAISEEASKKLTSLGTQQLGTLADLNLPCSDAVELRLREVVLQFADGVPNSLAGFEKGDYARLVEYFDLDCFGSRGDSYLLSLLCIAEAPRDFSERAALLVVQFQKRHAETWWRSDGLLHQRVVSYAEMDVEPFAARNCGALRSPRFQQNGYHGMRQGQDWIVATSLPLNSNVDRSLCSEYQLLSQVCEDLAGSRLQLSGPSRQQVAPGRQLLAGARGWLRLHVTGAPCLSCIGAMHQFQLLAPGVQLSISIGEELQFEGIGL